MLPTLELQNLAYNLFNVFGAVSVFLFNLTQLNRKKQLLSHAALVAHKHFVEKSEKGKMPKFLTSITFWAVVDTIVIYAFHYGVMPTLNVNFGSSIRTGANYYGLLFFMPIILIFACYLLWVNPLKQIDLITPSFPLGLFFSKIGCFGAGCCQGYVWSGGLYNYKTGYTEFPLQLVEAGVALLLFIFLLIWRKKSKPGTLFPTYMIAYSVIRFFTDFLSDRDAIIGPFNIYHILSVAGVIIGIIELLIVLEYGEKIQTFFAETPYGYFINIIKKIKEKPEKQKAKSKK